MSILDLGAGTGHLAVKAWRNLHRSSPARQMAAAFHLVDTSEPTFGRSFGISRDANDITHVEWTKADYRRLLDDDEWLRSNGPFDWVFFCRLLDNASNFLIERVSVIDGGPLGKHSQCHPHSCLAPRRQPVGVEQLVVRTVRRSVRGGTVMPQFSLSDYFCVMHAVVAGSLDAARAEGPYLPVRRFNPASLTTASGRSVITQLLKVASAIIIEDLDLKPDHLRTHKEQFGLVGTAAVHFRRDGFNTEVHHYVVAAPLLVENLAGERLW